MVGSVVLIIIWAIMLVLNIILFFKIWGMTNNVSNIKDILLHAFSTDNKTIENLESSINSDFSEYLSKDMQEKIDDDDSITGLIIFLFFIIFFIITGAVVFML